MAKTPTLPVQGAEVRFLVRELDPKRSATKSSHAATKKDPAVYD